MPSPRLVQLFRKFLERAQQRNTGGEETDFLLAGDVSVVRGNGSLLVNLDTGLSVSASPTTDELFIQGQRVWVSRTEEGFYIIHGGIR